MRRKCKFGFYTSKTLRRVRNTQDSNIYTTELASIGIIAEFLENLTASFWDQREKLGYLLTSSFGMGLRGNKK